MGEQNREVENLLFDGKEKVDGRTRGDAERFRRDIADFAFVAMIEKIWILKLSMKLGIIPIQKKKEDGKWPSKLN